MNAINLLWNYYMSMFYSLYYIKVKSSYRDEIAKYGLTSKHMNPSFKDFDLVKDINALSNNLWNNDIYLVRLPFWIDMLYVNECSFLPSEYTIEIEIKPKYLTLIEPEVKK